MSAAYWLDSLEFESIKKWKWTTVGIEEALEIWSYGNGQEEERWQWGWHLDLDLDLDKQSWWIELNWGRNEA